MEKELEKNQLEVSITAVKKQQIQKNRCKNSGFFKSGGEIGI
ncbi:hypothetical protein AT1219_11419 [Vibrio alginolyticus]